VANQADHSSPESGGQKISLSRNEKHDYKTFNSTVSVLCYGLYLGEDVPKDTGEIKSLTMRQATESAAKATRDIDHYGSSMVSLRLNQAVVDYQFLLTTSTLQVISSVNSWRSQEISV